MDSLTPPCLTSKRTNIQFLNNQDETLYCSLYTNAKLMKNISAPLSLSKAGRSFNAAVKQTHSLDHSHYYFSVRRKNTYDPLGLLSLFTRKNQGEIGILLLRSAHGKGFPLEILRTLIDYGFNQLELQQINANIGHSNKIAHKIAAKLGFDKITSKDKNSNFSTWLLYP